MTANARWKVLIAIAIALLAVVLVAGIAAVATTYSLETSTPGTSVQID